MGSSVLGVSGLCQEGGPAGCEQDETSFTQDEERVALLGLNGAGNVPFFN